MTDKEVQPAKPQVVDSQKAQWLRSRRHVLYTPQEVEDFSIEMRELKASITTAPGWSVNHLFWVIPVALGIAFIGFLLAGALFVGGDALIASLNS